MLPTSLFSYVWPLANKRGLNSSFAEWRDGHLHAGIDLPTESTGEEVFSVDDGWIHRVKISPWGYGKVIYIKNPSGFTFVYAHLSSFMRSIDSVMRIEQLRKGSYRVEKWFGKNEFNVSEGEVIAFSGRSGCLGPHLHFEMRDRYNRPINPLRNGFSVSDSIPPHIEALRFIPFNDESTIFGSHLGKVVPVNRDTVLLSYAGKIGVEISVFDRVNGHSGILAPEKIDVFRGDELIHRQKYDSFSYSNYKDSRFLFDYNYRIIRGKKFRKLFREEGNDYTFYTGRDIMIEEADSSTLKIIASDRQNNRDSTFLKLRNESNPIIRKMSEDSEKITITENGIYGMGRWYGGDELGSVAKTRDSLVVWNLRKFKGNTFSSPSGKFTLRISDGVKHNSNIIAVKEKGDSSRWTCSPQIPLDGSAEILVRSQEEKSSIYEIKGDDNDYLRTERRKGYLIASTDHLGTFSILSDTVKPEIYLKNKSISAVSPLEINIKDNLSGIDFYSIKTTIDGKNTVLRYDPQIKKLVHEYPEEIESGEHVLKVSVRDRQGNYLEKKWAIVKQ